MTARDARGRRHLPKPSIEPVVWKPPPAPPRARSRSGPTPLTRPPLIPLDGRAPEDVAVDADERLYTGVEDGRVFRIDPGEGHVELVADPGAGRWGSRRSTTGRCSCAMPIGDSCTSTREPVPCR